MYSIFRLTAISGTLALVCAALGQSNTASASTVPTQPAAALVAATTKAQADAPAAPATPPIVYSGMFDIYYGYNFNKPNGINATGPGQRNFDFKDDLISLGLAEFGISRATSDTSRFGFNVRLAFGPTEDFLTSPGDSDNKNILQAYGTYALPYGKKSITVDIGKMVTHMGLELIEPGSNWNYSRGLLFQYFIPYYHAGIRATVPLSDTVSATGYLYNGWNNVSFDSNASKAYGLEVMFTPNANNSIVLNALTSNEPINLTYTPGEGQPQSLTQSEPKTTLEAIWNHTFSPSLAGAIDLNYDFGTNAVVTSGGSTGDGSKWSGYGVAAYLKYTMKTGSYLAIRGEYMRDKDGFLLGLGNANAKEVTLTYSLQNPMFKGAELRFEYRHDACSQPGLFSGNSTTHQNTITISHLFTF